MAWIRSGLSSISGFFSGGIVAAPGDQRRLGQIRAVMLDALGPAGAARHSRLAVRIRHVGQVETLWDLRADLMNAACVQYGESQARALMARVDAEFAGAVPRRWTDGRRTQPQAH